MSYSGLYKIYSSSKCFVLKNYVAVWCIIYSILILSTLMLSISFATPDVEEFYLTLIPRDIGIYKSFKFYSIEFSGRYTSNLINGIHPLVFLENVLYYRFFLIGNALIFVVIMTWFIVSFFKMKVRESIVFSLFFTSLYISAVPSIFMSIFFLSGSFVYLLPSLFYVINLVLFKYYIEASDDRQFILFLILSLSLFISIGFSEMFLPVYFIINLAMFLYFFVYKRSFLKQIIPLNLIIILSIVFFLCIPAAFNRVAFYNFSIPEALTSSSYFYLIAIKKYIFKLEFILGFLVSFTLRNKIKMKFKNQLLIVVGTLVISYLMTIPFFVYAPNNPELEKKIYNPVVFILYFNCVFLIFPSFWNYLVTQSIKLFYAQKVAINIMFILIVLLTLFGKYGNMGVLLEDIRTKKTQAYYNYQEAFLNSLQANLTNIDKFHIACYNDTFSKPDLLFRNTHGTTNRYESYWNHSIEGYFHLNEIRTADGDFNKFQFNLFEND